jgi:hypothetical protein
MGRLEGMSLTNIHSSTYVNVTMQTPVQVIHALIMSSHELEKKEYENEKMRPVEIIIGMG